MKKLLMLATIATLMAMNVYADGPTATGEGDTDCSRIVQGTGEASGSNGATPVTSPTTVAPR